MRHQPRLCFFGAGPLARERLLAIAVDGAAEVVAIGDDDALKREVARPRTGCGLCESFDALLQQSVDGLVPFTPGQAHAAQAGEEPARGLAVFSLRPLARSAGETRTVVVAEQHPDRLLGVDLPYRRTGAMQAVCQFVAAGDIGEVFAVDLIFHRALGPARAWLLGPHRPGSGCISDLDVHMMDPAPWVLYFERMRIQGARTLAAPPNTWESWAAVHWFYTLAAGGRFHPIVRRLVQVAEVVDAIHGRGPPKTWSSGWC